MEIKRDQLLKSRAQLKRYLILGAETAIYTPGDRVSEPQFRPSSLPALDELIASDVKDLVVDVILESAKSPYHDPALLAYTLALLSKSEKQVRRSEAYSAISTLFLTSDQLFLFVKFLREIVQGGKGRIWGAGCRNAITKWYNSKDAETLTRILTTQKQYYGINHKDIIKQVHFKASSPVIDAVIKHFVFGKEAELPEALRSISSDIKELRTTEDAFKAAYLLSHLRLSSSYVPFRFAKSPQMWTEYIKNVPVIELLHKLEFFTASRILSSIVLPAATSIINDNDGTNVDPAEIYIALRRYEICAKFLRRERAIQKRRAAATAPTPGAAAKVEKETKGKVKTIGPKACATVVSAVKNLLERSIKTLPAGELKWVVGLDFADGGAGDCLRIPGVSPGGAAALTIQWVQRIAASTTFFTSGKVAILPDCDVTVPEMAVKIRGVKAEPQTLFVAVTRAINEKVAADAFLILSDQKSGFSKALAEGVKHLEDYRSQLQRPETKLVIVFLKCNQEVTVPDHQGIFVVRGFDGRVPRLIEGFVNGLI